jgi:four helix bundle protein
MLNQFRTYQLSIQFYRECEKLKLPRHLKDQILRASSSITLNLAEGSAKPTRKDQMRFYFIAFGSLRECQAILSLASHVNCELLDLADHLAASLYRLTRNQVASRELGDK